MASHPHASIPIFPPSATVAYLAEGAANVIYRVTNARDIMPVSSAFAGLNPMNMSQPRPDPEAVSKTERLVRSQELSPGRQAPTTEEGDP